ncbi:isochorismatase family protein [Hyphococcus sp.]|uniref:isochorismatase family protein n=1 Tax=Hyphococcus sp. TaxID=2038636 RepID=UPI0035C774F9
MISLCLLSPRDCLLAIVISVPANKQFSAHKHAFLSALAAECNVPALTLEATTSSGAAIVSPDDIIRITPTMLADPLADEKLERRINSYKKDKLILAGETSEGAVTFTAISALVRGFDVYVIDDLCSGSSAYVHQLAMQRLVQAGAILTTTSQLQAEWGATRLQPAAVPETGKVSEQARF